LLDSDGLPPAADCSRSAPAGSGGRRFRIEPGEDAARGADKLVRPAEQFPVNGLVHPAAALAGAEAELALPRGREQQAAPVETPAAEHAPHFQSLDGTKRILGIDADLVFGLPHNGRLRRRADKASGTQESAP
jgi:hypothetical protein